MRKDCVCDRRQMPAEEDVDVEAAVLALLIDECPRQMTAAEVVRGMFVDEDDCLRRDAVERAVRDLVAVGLAHRHGEFVFPTRAALRREELSI